MMENNEMRTVDIVPAAIWVILGVVITTTSYHLGIGILSNPGPGLVPFSLGILLILFALPILVLSLKRFKREEERKENIWTRTGVCGSRIVMTVITLVVYGFVLERVGFFVTTIVCLSFLFKLSGLGKIWTVLIYAGVVTALAYLLFVVILKGQLPTFPWDAISP